MISSRIENLIHKFLNRSSENNDMDELSQWITKSTNAKIFKNYVKTHYIITGSMNNLDSDKIAKELLTKIRKDKSILNRFKAKSVLKYASVIALTLFIGHLFTDEPDAITADDKSITLKLDDGSVKIINDANEAQIVNSNGSVIGIQKGNKMVYDGISASNELVYNELKVPYGKRFDIVLSDGTNVSLNAGTTIKYPVKFLPGKEREVYLMGGEAFFNVVKDTKHPFRVNAQELNVEVLGTKFNMAVYSEDESSDIVLVEGSKSEASIREAMFEGRTAAYFENTIVGHHEHLKQLFEASVEVVDLPMIVETFSRFIQFKNSSDIDFELEFIDKPKGTKMPKLLSFKAHKVNLTTMNLYNDSVIQANSLKATYKVKNLISISGNPVIVEFEFLKKNLL